MSRRTLTDTELEQVLFESSPYPDADGAGRRQVPTGVASSRPALSKHVARRRGGATWVAPAVAGVLTAGVVLSVVPFALQQGGQPDPADQTVPTVGPSQSDPAEDVPADGVVATGAFESPDGSTSGRVEVRLRDGVALVVFLDVESTHAAVGVEASLVSRENDPCTDGRGLSWGEADSGSLTIRELPGDLVDGDWTAFDEIDLTVRTDASSGCVNTIIARAPLIWSLSPARPWLATILDGGEREGATGIAAVEGGRVVTYTVAADDSMDAVSQRFGITSEDLGYLNLLRAPRPDEDDKLAAGETLNLDILKR